MTPTLASSQEVDSTASNLLSTVSSAITVNNGDVIVVKAMSENQGSPASGIPTASGQTFTSKNTSTTTSNVNANIYTCVVTGSPGTITVTTTWTGSSGWHSMVVERWTNAVLAATPAVNATKSVTSSGGFNGSITTAAANSAVTWCAGDWSANAPGTIGYRSSATQDGLHDKSTGSYVGYYAYQSAGAAGAQSFGLTTPAASGAWKYLAIEVQDAGGAPAYNFATMMPPRTGY
jgi:hypothetical protein